MDRMKMMELKTYQKILKHRLKCNKWGIGFCLDCFGGGLSKYTYDFMKEQVDAGVNDKIIEVTDTEGKFFANFKKKEFDKIEENIKNPNNKRKPITLIFVIGVIAIAVGIGIFIGELIW